MEDQIRRRAYEMWEAAGRPEGQDQAYWFKAVQEIASAGLEPKPARTRSPRLRQAA